MHDEYEVCIFSSVYLWNDFDRIKGILYLSSEHLDFVAKGFEQTHLTLRIPLSQIVEMESYKLFDITISGLSISTLDGKTNIFILEEAQALKKKITFFKKD